MTAPGPDAAASARPCPFCGAEVAGGRCPGCGRDVTARRRVCPRCHRMTPADEPVCSHCGAAFRSELRWKIPLIIALFVLAFIVAVALQLAR